MTKTLFIDIDGTLIPHDGFLAQIEMINGSKASTLLPGTLERFAEWDQKGHRIILVTGRRESMREATEKQLASLGIFYDQLIMGCGNGQRILINDYKPEHPDIEMAIGISLKRNSGIGDVKV